MALSGDYPRFLRVVALTYQMIYYGPVRGLFGALRPPVGSTLPTTCSTWIAKRWCLYWESGGMTPTS